MALLVDRPWPKDHVDPVHGVEFVIAFRWGDNQNQVPLEVVVLTEVDGRTIVADVLQRAWESLDGAIAAGKDSANKFAKKYWVE